MDTSDGPGGPAGAGPAGRRRGPWSIAMYSGPSPLALAPHPGARNPVISSADVSGAPAMFVADPFMIRRRDRWFMFFEILPEHTRVGSIGLAESPDGILWTYRDRILAEPYHLSYPAVFEWQGEFYMCPETLGAGAVRLYQADPFPYAWRPVAELCSIAAADPTPFHWEGRWWLFACTTPSTHDTLSLFFSDDLTGPYREHPASPIVTGDAARARPAGRVIVHQGLPLRFAQICRPHYGVGVRAFQINELTPSTYREEEATGSPVLAAGDAGWNHAGMHHVDAHQTPDGGWIACVDGREFIQPARRPA